MTRSDGKGKKHIVNKIQKKINHFTHKGRLDLCVSSAKRYVLTLLSFTPRMRWSLMMLKKVKTQTNHSKLVNLNFIRVADIFFVW